MSRDWNSIQDIDRYRPMGLFTNPFTTPENSKDFGGVELEVTAASNRLLSRILEAAGQAAPKPIVVLKSEAIPNYYSLRAAAQLQRPLAADEGIGVLHAYVQLYMMRLGRVRSIISILAERLAFRSFDKTLEFYIAQILAQPDVDLLAYQIIGEDGLVKLAERFKADPAQLVLELFGGAKIERHPELAELGDRRLGDLESDVDEDESIPELDSALGDAPANAVLIAESAVQGETENNDQELVDYIVEYTKVHYSPVIARGLRVYRERGLSAMTTEWKVTKAPKKTLSALARFARVRFCKVALIFDGFESWAQIPADVRSLIAGTLSEVRWLLESDAIMIIILEEERVAELEEQFGGGVRLVWDFAPLRLFEENDQLIDKSVVDGWLAAATLPGLKPITMDNPVLAELASTSDGLSVFALRAATAIESAANRGVSVLDEDALGEARLAQTPEANTQ